MNIDKDKQAKAGDKLKDLLPLLQEFVEELENGSQPDGLAWAKAYRLRWHINKAIENLGYGQPDYLAMKRAKEIIDSQVKMDSKWPSLDQ